MSTTHTVKTPYIVGGEMPPLTSQQRRLVEIFVWYLRLLPEWDTERSWESNEYGLVNKLLFRFFKGRNPSWSRRKDENGYWVSDLPDSEAEEYNDLMYHAAPGRDPKLDRRKTMLSLGRAKKRLLRAIEVYEQSRSEFGLEPDFTLPRKPATPLERSTEATWGNQ